MILGNVKKLICKLITFQIPWGMNTQEIGMYQLSKFPICIEAFVDNYYQY